MDDRVVVAVYRHGLTEANKNHQYLGWTDSSVCKDEQERITQERNSHSFYHQYFCSDLSRCTSSLNLLNPEAIPILLKEFREINFGDWEGRTYEELKHDLQYQDWISSPFTVKPPNGESYLEFTDRVRKGWEKIITTTVKQGDSKVMLMSHGGVLRYLISTYSPIKLDFWDIHAPYCGGYELVWTKNGFWRGEKCILLREVPITAKQNG
ncbi:alpha-ribazole phosphatase [Bacillus pakistanensis]|uniref:phosphoglycerate mutase (2,3-diphosphoglycerate-dependent) n=1 Tax=Rossellomorea pakistanensis TaxID=992288 RepID=A0ABS2N7K3_9BACI|nr:histidine phosphatase family protein [Bacillus pakistanensis]MBM7583840.1 alpha-ribazole phosphatase [Bacillus pakistanensis]